MLMGRVQLPVLRKEGRLPHFWQKKIHLYMGLPLVLPVSTTDCANHVRAFLSLLLVFLVLFFLTKRMLISASASPPPIKRTGWFSELVHGVSSLDFWVGLPSCDRCVAVREAVMDGLGGWFMFFCSMRGQKQPKHVLTCSPLPHCTRVCSVVGLSQVPLCVSATVVPSHHPSLSRSCVQELKESCL